MVRPGRFSFVIARSMEPAKRPRPDNVRSQGARVNWDVFSARESAPGHMTYDGWEFRPARPGAEKPTEDSGEAEAQSELETTASL